VLRKFLLCLLVIISLLSLTGCGQTKEQPEPSVPVTNDLEQKAYHIPPEKQKESYSIEDFKEFHYEYLKLNNIKSLPPSESSGSEAPKNDSLANYKVYDITPETVKKEIKCQIFKVDYSCEAYVIYKSKVFHIGLGFGGLGVVDIATCNFDGNRQKDLIYTYSFGSGLHRSHIGVFNLTEEKEQTLDFIHLNKDMMLEKVSDKSFKVYNAEVAFVDDMGFSNFKLSKQEHIADVKSSGKKIKITKR
jgi:hypothetical protein